MPRRFLGAGLVDVVACGQDEEPGRCHSAGIGDIDYVRLHNDEKGKMTQRKSLSDFTEEDVFTNLDMRRCEDMTISEHDQSSESHEEGSKPTTFNWKKRKKMIIMD